MKTQVGVERTAEAQDECHRAGVGRAEFDPGLSDQMRGKGAADDAKRAAHEYWANCEEKTQRIGKAHNLLAQALMRQDLVDR